VKAERSVKCVHLNLQARDKFGPKRRYEIDEMDYAVNCPKCNSEHSYADGNLWICPECAHEWNSGEASDAAAEDEDGLVIKDAHGNVLQDGDAVTVIKDLRLKGSSLVVKVGTKVRNIRLVDSSDGHNIDCKIDGIGAMSLKSEFVKKS
jgi:protein PhnA